MRPFAASFDKIGDSSGDIATVSEAIAIRLESFDQGRCNGALGRSSRDH
jgi:hypothetical protein